MVSLSRMMLRLASAACLLSSASGRGVVTGAYQPRSNQITLDGYTYRQVVGQDYPALVRFTVNEPEASIGDLAARREDIEESRGAKDTSSEGIADAPFDIFADANQGTKVLFVNVVADLCSDTELKIEGMAGVYVDEYQDDIALSSYSVDGCGRENHDILELYGYKKADVELRPFAIKKAKFPKYLFVPAGTLKEPEKAVEYKPPGRFSGMDPYDHMKKFLEKHGVKFVKRGTVQDVKDIVVKFVNAKTKEDKQSVLTEAKDIMDGLTFEDFEICEYLYKTMEKTVAKYKPDEKKPFFAKEFDRLTTVLEKGRNKLPAEKIAKFQDEVDKLNAFMVPYKKQEL